MSSQCFSCLEFDFPAVRLEWVEEFDRVHAVLRARAMRLAADLEFVSGPMAPRVSPGHVESLLRDVAVARVAVARNLLDFQQAFVSRKAELDELASATDRQPPMEATYAATAARNAYILGTEVRRLQRAVTDAPAFAHARRSLRDAPADVVAEARRDVAEVRYPPVQEPAEFVSSVRPLQPELEDLEAASAGSDVTNNEKRMVA